MQPLHGAGVPHEAFKACGYGCSTCFAISSEKQWLSRFQVTPNHVTSQADWLSEHVIVPASLHTRRPNHIECDAISDARFKRLSYWYLVHISGYCDIASVTWPNCIKPYMSHAACMVHCHVSMTLACVKRCEGSMNINIHAFRQLACRLDSRSDGGSTLSYSMGGRQYVRSYGVPVQMYAYTPNILSVLSFFD